MRGPLVVKLVEADLNDMLRLVWFFKKEKRLKFNGVCRRRFVLFEVAVDTYVLLEGWLI